jgi:hypothetical protein
MAKPILVFKIHSYPTQEAMDNIANELGKEYFIIWLSASNGENESVSLLQKGRQTKTLTKQLKRLLNGKRES